MGNIFARRPGKDNSLPPVMTGSHLDTQPTGGKFDGIYGVMAGLEVVRTLNDFNYETQRAGRGRGVDQRGRLALRAGHGGSGVFAGVFPLDYGLSRADLDGKTMGEELKRIGYAGPEQVGGRDVFAFFEAHIEQGPILEAEKKTIGVVQGAQGQRWFEVTMVGQEAHAGPTPMKLRKDALVGAAHVVSAVNRIGHAQPAIRLRDRRHDQVQPELAQHHPGQGLLHHRSAPSRRRGADEDGGELRSGSRRGRRRRTACSCDFKEIWYSPPVKFDTSCVAAVKAGAEELGYARHADHQRRRPRCLLHGRVAPTGMIFVPCEDGISHNEIENATRDDCGAGCESPHNDGAAAASAPTYCYQGHHDGQVTHWPSRWTRRIAPFRGAP